MRRYLKLSVWLLILEVVIYHLLNYDNFPLSPNYQFPYFEILVAYCAGLPLVLSVEWYFQHLLKRYKPVSGGLISRVLSLQLTLFVIVFTISFFIISNGNFLLFYLINSILLSIISLIFWNVFAYGGFYYQYMKRPKTTSSTLTIKSGKTTYSVSFSELVFFQSTNKMVLAYLDTGKPVITDFKLNHLEEVLPGDFFRINRQVIINKPFIGETTRIENQKLELKLKHEAYPETYVVSRYRANEFLQWLR